MRKQNITTALLSFLFAGTLWAQPSLKEWKEASELHPIDVTSLVANASGTESTRVWNRHSADAAAGYNKNNPDFASTAYNGIGIESWYRTPQKNADLIWQDVNLLPGTYRVTAYVVAQVYNNATRKGQNIGTVSLRAGDGMTAFTNNKWQEAVATGKVKGGEALRIGIHAGNDNANDWVSIARVKVECLGVNLEEAEKVALNENYDVCALREATYADFTMEKSLTKGEWSIITLPCDLEEEDVKKLFSKVLMPGKLTVDGENATMATRAVSTIQAGKPYLVLPHSTTNSLSFTAVMGLPESQATTVEGWVPTYRQRMGLADCYIADTMDGKTVLRRVGANEPVKGFGAYLNAASRTDLKADLLNLTIVEQE